MASITIHTPHKQRACILDVPAVVYSTNILTFLSTSEIYDSVFISKQFNNVLFDFNLLTVHFKLRYQHFLHSLNISLDTTSLSTFLDSLKFYLKVYEHLASYRKTIFKRKDQIFYIENNTFHAKAKNDFINLEGINASSWTFENHIFHIAGHQFNPLACIVLNDGTLFIREPKRIVSPIRKFFIGKTLKSSVSKISIGCKHTICITLDGKAYVWGETADGKLGLGDRRSNYESKPTLLNLKEFQLENTFFINCSAGEAHTCLLDTLGNVYATGYGDGGRLGNNTCRNQNTFRKMSFRSKHCLRLSQNEQSVILTKKPPKIVAVECARAWTLLLTVDGIPYGTGKNTENQMGYSFRDHESNNWVSPTPIFFNNSVKNNPYTNNMKNTFVKCKFIRGGYFQNRSYFIDHKNQLWITPSFKRNVTLWNRNNISTIYHEIVDADVDSSVLKLLRRGSNGKHYCYYYDLNDKNQMTTEKEEKNAKINFDKHLYIGSQKTSKKMQSTVKNNLKKNNNNHNKKVSLKAINIISADTITFENVNLNIVTSVNNDYRIFLSNKSYHPKLTAYILDNVFSESMCNKIDQLRNNIELDLKRPTCARRFFKEWDGTETQQSRHSESGWVGKAFEQMFKRLHLPFHTMPWFRYLEYDTGGSMAKHSDGSNTHIVNRNLIRSTHTLLYYLNDCDDGGETTLFTKKNKQTGIKKKKKKKDKHLEKSHNKKVGVKGNDVNEIAIDTLNIKDEADKNILEIVKAKRNRLLIFPHSCEHEGNIVGKDAKIALRAEIYMYGEQYGCDSANNTSWYDTDKYFEYYQKNRVPEKK